MFNSVQQTKIKKVELKYVCMFLAVFAFSYFPKDCKLRDVAKITFKILTLKLNTDIPPRMLNFPIAVFPSTNCIGRVRLNQTTSDPYKYVKLFKPVCTANTST